MRPILLATLFSCALSLPALAGDFTLTSPDITAGQPIAPAFAADRFGCTGGNHSPALHWSGAPAGTKSFMLTVYDPDAPTGSGWWHWMVYNLPPETRDLPQGAGNPGGKLPAGAVKGRNDAGDHDYLGPCPPVGDRPHHYIFTLRALNVAKLDLPAEASPAMVGFAAHGAVLAETSLTGLFQR